MKALTIHLEYAGDETWNLWCPTMQRCYPVPEDRLASTIESIRLDWKHYMDSVDADLGKPSVEDIIKDIPIPIPRSSLPACKILKTEHAGVYPGQIGSIFSEIPGEGYAVLVDETYVKSGGDNGIRQATKFFKFDEIQSL